MKLHISSNILLGLTTVLTETAGGGVMAAADATEVKGRGSNTNTPFELRSVPPDMEEDVYRQLADSAKKIHNGNNNKKNLRRQLSDRTSGGSRGSRKKADITEAFIKTYLCGTCLGLDSDDMDMLITNEVIATQCNSNDPFQSWNLISLESTKTWFQFENDGSTTDENESNCMVAVGMCETDPFELPTSNSISDDTPLIQTTECNKSDPYQIWGWVGGNIVNYKCFLEWKLPSPGNFPLTTDQSSFEPIEDPADIFLATNTELDPRCNGNDLRLTSIDSSREQNSNAYWIIIPKSFDTSSSSSEEDLIPF